MESETCYELIRAHVVFHHSPDRYEYAFGDADEIKSESNSLWFKDGKLVDGDEIDPLITNQDGKLVISHPLVQITLEDTTDYDWKQEIAEMGLRDFFAPAKAGLERIAHFYAQVKMSHSVVLVVGYHWCYEVRGYYSDCPEPYVYPVIETVNQLSWSKVAQAIITPDEYQDELRAWDEHIARAAFQRGELPYTEAS